MTTDQHQAPEAMTDEQAHALWKSSPEIQTNYAGWVRDKRIAVVHHVIAARDAMWAERLRAQPAGQGETVPRSKYDELVQAEHALSAAYVRLREIVGAMNPPVLSPPEAVWSYVEEVARRAVSTQPAGQAVPIESSGLHYLVQPAGQAGGEVGWRSLPATLDRLAAWLRNPANAEGCEALALSFAEWCQAVVSARAALLATPAPEPKAEPVPRDELPGMWDTSDLIGGETDCNQQQRAAQAKGGAA